MRSFPACDPKIASEYIPLSQRPKYLPLWQRGPGGFNDRPKETPEYLPLWQNPKYLPLWQRGPGGFSQPASNGRNGSGDGEDLSASDGEGGDVENGKSPLTPLFQRGGMFCCFLLLVGMQPKIASEYLSSTADERNQNVSRKDAKRCSCFLWQQGDKGPVSTKTPR
jgi:hypothetical protein